MNANRGKKTFISISKLLLNDPSLNRYLRKKENEKRGTNDTK